MAADREMEQLADAMIRGCLEAEDPLSCTIETIEMIPPSLVGCRPELLLFTQEDCAVCKEDLEKYAALLKEGILREVDARSEEGQRIMDANDLPATPTLALVDCAGKLIAEFYDSRAGGDV